MKEEEKVVVEEGREGWEKGFNRVYNKYYKRVWYSGKNVVDNWDGGDDIRCMVFSKVYLKLECYSNDIWFEMWLKRIRVNSGIE